MATLRRRQNSERWHWSEDCSNFPTEKDVIIIHEQPEYGISFANFLNPELTI